MTTHSLDDRIAKAKALIVKGEANIARHRANAVLHEAKGRHEKAVRSLEMAERQEGINRDHAREVERWTAARAGVSQREFWAASAKRVANERKEEAPRPDALTVYAECLQHARELDEEAISLHRKADGYERAGDATKAASVRHRAKQREEWALGARESARDTHESSGRDLPREYGVMRKSRHRKDERAREEESRQREANLEGDLRTAGSQRVIAIGGPKKGRIASAADYATRIPRPQDRTPRRLDTMYRFDNLCGTAMSGLFPEPRFEAESRGKGDPGAQVMQNRAAGLEEMQDIVEVLGQRTVDMLRMWVFENHTLTHLVREGYATEKTAGRVLLAVLDELAVFWKTGDALAARRTSIATASRVA